MLENEKKKSQAADAEIAKRNFNNKNSMEDDDESTSNFSGESATKRKNNFRPGQFNKFKRTAVGSKGASA